MREIPSDINAKKPKGAPFFIDEIDFAYGETIDYAQFDLAEDKIFDWPMVYILSSDDVAYVGKTTSAINRLNQHSRNEERRVFKKANVIFNEEFNTSVVTDYEHKLIEYMSSDTHFTLTNKNSGEQRANYFSKEEYQKMFETLWSELRGLELADLTLHEIEESEVFKYSPYKTLTPDQKVALDKIMSSVKGDLDNAEPIVVIGGPGTGKTVLAICLLKMLKDDEKLKDLNIKLLEPIGSLRKTLQKSLHGISNLSASDIIGPAELLHENQGYRPGQKKNFDIVIVDEAHKLKQSRNLGAAIGSHYAKSETLGLPRDSSQLDWLLDQVKLPIFFYDEMQAIGPSCINPQEFVAKLGFDDSKCISLSSQMRCRGGKDYLEYIASILNDENTEPTFFEDYDLYLHTEFSDFIDCFCKDLAKHDLTRMIAGYAWKWVTKSTKGDLKDSDERDIVIDGIALRWNRVQENWVGLGVENPEISHEVGCIHTIQGYDLSKAYVIIGNDLRFDPATQQIYVDKKSYYDTTGKNTATQEELERYIRNIYYVLLTRGILGTHIYVCDQALREHFQKYFPNPQ